jgi:hypothetical protein
MAVGLIKDVPTCKQLIADMVSEARRLAGQRLPSIMGLVGPVQSQAAAL